MKNQFKTILEGQIEEELKREDLGAENPGRDVPAKSVVKDKDKAGGKDAKKLSKKDADPLNKGIERQDI